MSTEFNPQEVWWWRFQALSAKVASLSMINPQLEDEAWQALDRAREVMLGDIASLQDAGLRRNYLNKVLINREIVQAWLRAARARELPPSALTDQLGGQGDLQGQLERLFESGVRLNARAEAPEARTRWSGEQPILRGKRLLIVDDNATNRHILALQTRAWGMLARDTASPHEALEWIARGDPFDLAILDMQMPRWTAWRSPARYALAGRALGGPTSSP